VNRFEYVNIRCKEDGKVLTGDYLRGLLPLKIYLKKVTVEIQFIGYKTVSKTVVLSIDQNRPI
jgi:hypothetical protein